MQVVNPELEKLIVSLYVDKNYSVHGVWVQLRTKHTIKMSEEKIKKCLRRNGVVLKGRGYTGTAYNTNGKFAQLEK